jgi:hypothetical protein
MQPLFPKIGHDPRYCTPQTQYLSLPSAHCQFNTQYLSKGIIIDPYTYGLSMDRGSRGGDSGVGDASAMKHSNRILEDLLGDRGRSKISGVCEGFFGRNLSVSTTTAVMPTGIVTLLGCNCGIFSLLVLPVSAVDMRCVVTLLGGVVVDLRFPSASYRCLWCFGSPCALLFIFDLLCKRVSSSPYITLSVLVYL